MLVLGIESSCDETAAAVVRDGRTVLSNIVHSQVAEHAPYGGVVPELASRCHVEVFPGIVRQALADAGADWPAIDAVAVTYGPGLASSLLIGVTAARALALRTGKPLLGVNHLAAHLYSPFLDPAMPAPHDAGPMLVLLVTGGNTALVRVDAPGRLALLGQTVDDAAGEALDKGATLLGLPYPGGPAIEAAAEEGRADFATFPAGRVRQGVPGLAGSIRPEFCFSYSGVKTALMYYLRQNPDALPDHLADVAASYQEAVFKPLAARLALALRTHRVDRVACVGGVARNRRLRGLLHATCRTANVPLAFAPPAYCTDNAAMVAGLAGSGLPGATVPLEGQGMEPSLPLAG